MCPVSGTKLEEPDFEDMSGCVPSPPWASAVRTPVFGQTDVQDKPKRQTIRAYHPDLSPSFPAPACTSAFSGKEPRSHLQDTSHICWTSCVLMVTHECKLEALLTTLTTFQRLRNCFVFDRWLEFVLDVVMLIKNVLFPQSKFLYILLLISF